MGRIIVPGKPKIQRLECYHEMRTSPSSNYNGMGPIALNPSHWQTNRYLKGWVLYGNPEPPAHPPSPDSVPKDQIIQPIKISTVVLRMWAPQKRLANLADTTLSAHFVHRFGHPTVYKFRQSLCSSHLLTDVGPQPRTDTTAVCSTSWDVSCSGFLGIRTWLD
jgi:hypothetical protein